jgi:hypothetical protein
MRLSQHLQLKMHLPQLHQLQLFVIQCFPKFAYLRQALRRSATLHRSAVALMCTEGGCTSTMHEPAHVLRRLDLPWSIPR